MLDPVLISPYCRWSETQVSLAAGAPTLIVGIDQCRVLLLFSMVSAGGVATVSTMSTVSGTAGVQLNSSNQRLEIPIDKYPGIVQGEWWGVGNAGPQSLNVISVSIRRDAARSYGQQIRDVLGRLVTPRSQSWEEKAIRSSSVLQTQVRKYLHSTQNGGR